MKAIQPRTGDSGAAPERGAVVGTLGWEGGYSRCLMDSVPTSLQSRWQVAG